MNGYGYACCHAHVKLFDVNITATSVDFPVKIPCSPVNTDFLVTEISVTRLISRKGDAMMAIDISSISRMEMLGFWD